MSPPGLDITALSATELEVRLSGTWSQTAKLPPPPAFQPYLSQHQEIRRLVLDTGQLESWDSRLPGYLIPLLDECRARAITVDDSRLPEGLKALLQLALTVPERSGARQSGQKPGWQTQLGHRVLEGWNDLKSLVEFIGATSLALLALLQGQARFRRIDVLIALQAAGPGALAIVTLISLLVGLILAFVGAVQLSLFGAQIYIADLVGLGMSREMGALMTAVIMAGRTGAAYAAQLGTMNVNSEIDALRTLGIAPVEFLVLPRLIALIVMMPLLGIYAVFVGILGGWLVATAVFDISLVQFFNGVIRAVDLYDYGIGFTKCLSFAVLIALAGCMRGMQCGQSAEGVGNATTRAVVDSIVYIVLADSIITLICNQLGI